jgi:hypothetical protein
LKPKLSPDFERLAENQKSQNEGTDSSHQFGGQVSPAARLRQLIQNTSNKIQH